ncbi:MAG: metallophosphoesterase [Pseudomonadota bacterium]
MTGMARLAPVTWRIESPAWGERKPLRIVAVGDLHIGLPWMGAREIAKVVEIVRSLEGDLLVLLGDYVTDQHMVTPKLDADGIAALLRPFLESPPPLGVWSILGNHDWADLPRMRNGCPPLWPAIEAVGIPVLENRAVKRDHGGPFWLVGLGSQQAFKHEKIARLGSDDLDRALDGTADGAPRILLAHEPDIFPSLPPGIFLTLSGHTHAGQIRPFGRTLWVPSKHGTRYAHGHFVEGSDRDHHHLIVTAGIGCSGLPIRWNANPEIAVIEISGP